MPTNARSIELGLIQLEQELRPDHPRLVLYDIAGQTVFAIYAMSGGIAAAFMSYWILRGSGPLDGQDLGRNGFDTFKPADVPWRRLAIEIDPFSEPQATVRKVRRQVLGFLEWAEQDNPETIQDVEKWLDDRDAAKAKGVVDAT